MLPALRPHRGLPLAPLRCLLSSSAAGEGGPPSAPADAADGTKLHSGRRRLRRARHAMLPALRPRRGLPLAPLRCLLSSSAAGEGGPPSAPADAAAAAAAKAREAAAARMEAYKQVQTLDWSSGADWKTAANILFTVPPKRKKFGLDFHLVQLFFACMPSLAVYLLAQYARSEIKRMEAEAEKKRKKDEELEKEKQLEADPVKEDADSKLSTVLIRLDTLEGVVKEIVDDKRKGSVRLDTLEGVVKEIVDDKRKGSSLDLSTKEDALKKDETSSPDKASDSNSNASDSQLVSVNSKYIKGVTNALSNTTQQNTKWNGDKAIGESKS